MTTRDRFEHTAWMRDVLLANGIDPTKTLEGAAICGRRLYWTTVEYDGENSYIVNHEKDIVRSQESRPQVGGSHYQQGDIEPIDYIRANQLDFCEGNVVKYVSRWRYKGGVEDLRKARQYVDFLLEDAEEHPERYGLD